MFKIITASEYRTLKYELDTALADLNNKICEINSLKSRIASMEIVDMPAPSVNWVELEPLYIDKQHNSTYTVIGYMTPDKILRELRFMTTMDTHTELVKQFNDYMANKE